MKIISSPADTNQGSTDWFTGNVYIDPIQVPDETSRLSAAHVRFAPGARTAWHTHPEGQTLYVTDGIGKIGRRGQVRLIRPGDIIYIAPGEEHWHGGAPDHFMAHIALNLADENGSVATWGKHVSDSDYQADM